MPSVITLVAIVVSGPSLASAAEVVKSFVFEASGSCLVAPLAQTTSSVSESTTSRPLEAPPPAFSQLCIWEHGVAAAAGPASASSADADRERGEEQLLHRP